MIDKQTVLITGASGFVGSAMCVLQHNLGNHIIAIDNLSRGLNEVWKLNSVDFYEKDLLEGIDDILQETQPSVVYHFAAATGDLTRPEKELEKLNVLMTIDLYNACTKYDQLPIFVYPTTSLALKVPDSTYVKTKEAAMDWLLTNDKGNLLPFRFFNNAGAGSQQFGERRQLEVHLLPRLVDCYVNHKVLTINGNDYPTEDGTPSRDWVSVKDVVAFINHCVDLKQHNKLHYPRVDGLLEVGNGYPVTVLQTVEIFKEVMKQLEVPGELHYVIGPRRDFDCDQLSCSTAGVLHNWRAQKLSHMQNVYQIIHDQVVCYLNTGMPQMKD